MARLDQPSPAWVCASLRVALLQLEPAALEVAGTTCLLTECIGAVWHAALDTQAGEWWQPSHSRSGRCSELVLLRCSTSRQRSWARFCPSCLSPCSRGTCIIHWYCWHSAAKVLQSLLMTAVASEALLAFILFIVDVASVICVTVGWFEQLLLTHGKRRVHPRD